MKITRMVQRKWQRLRERRRKYVRSVAKRHHDANTRCRAQIIMALVRGKQPREIVEVFGCSATLVRKVAHRFCELCEGAFADRPLYFESMIAVVRMSISKVAPPYSINGGGSIGSM